MSLQSIPALTQRIAPSHDVVVTTRPMDAGFISWNYDPAAPGQSLTSSGTAGMLFLSRVELPDVATLIRNMHVGLGAAAAGHSNCYAGLYSSDGTLRIGSADESFGAWLNTANPLKTIVGASGQTWSKPATVNDFAWLGVLTGAATTLPGFVRTGNLALNLGLTVVTNTRWGRYGTGLTALPANLVVANISQASLSGQYLWAGIS